MGGLARPVSHLCPPWTSLLSKENAVLFKHQLLFIYACTQSERRRGEVTSFRWELEEKIGVKKFYWQAIFNDLMTGLGYGNWILCHTETPPLLPSPPRLTNHQSLLVYTIIFFFLSLGYCYQKLSFCIYICVCIYIYINNSWKKIKMCWSDWNFFFLNVFDWFVKSERGKVWLFAKHSATTWR